MEIKKLSEYMRQWVQLAEPNKQSKVSGNIKQTAVKAEGSFATGDRVELSIKTNDVGTERAEKLSRIKAQIEEGTYKVSPEEIASRMLEESW